MVNNQPIIYYRDNRLDKFRTAKSLLSYYFREWWGGRPAGRVIVDRSVENLDAF